MSGQQTNERRVEYLPLHEIARAPRNPKRHDQPAIRRSISRYGLAEAPLLDERTGRLVAGHGRLDDLAARHDAGEEPPDGVRVAADGTWLVPVQRGWASRSDDEAHAYLLVSNRAGELGGWDHPELAQLLTDLAAADEELLQVAGWTEDQLADVQRLAEPDPDREPPGEFPTYDETIPTEHTCPACGYQFSGGKSGGE